MTVIYKNPPLEFVKAEIWWHSHEFSHFDHLKLLNGLVFNSLSEEFPQIENGFSREDKPLGSVFSNEEKKLVLEISNSSASLISTDENYNWDDFIKSIQIVFGTITDILIDLINPDHLHGVLVYEDYFSCNFDSFDNVISLASDLKLSFKSELISDPKSFRFAFVEKYDQGNITVDYKTVNNKRRRAGIYVNFNVDSNTFKPDENEILVWFNGAHEICRLYFNRMIEGNIKQQLHEQEI